MNNYEYISATHPGQGGLALVRTIEKMTTTAYDETFTCEVCELELDWDLYVFFKEEYSDRGEPYHPDDGAHNHRCINCHNDIVFTRIINFIDEMN